MPGDGGGSVQDATVAGASRGRRMTRRHHFLDNRPAGDEDNSMC